MEFILEKVKLEDKNILYQLLQYLLFEISANDNTTMNEKGHFEYPWFDNYFTDRDRAAYFVKDEITEELLGFVMINKHLQKFKNGHSIAEFMILPKYRRQKIGQKVAIEIFKIYKGNWEIHPSNNNSRAFSFWNNTIKEYTNNNYKFEDDLFLFSNK